MFLSPKSGGAALEAAPLTPLLLYAHPNTLTKSRPLYGRVSAPGPKDILNSACVNPSLFAVTFAPLV